MVRPLDWKKIPEKYQHIPQMPLAPPQTVLYEIPLEEQEPAEQYEVEGIVADKMENGQRLYRVRWKGYDYPHDTWKFREELGEAEDALKKYLKSKKRMIVEERGKSGFELGWYPQPVATQSSSSRVSSQALGVQLVSNFVTAAEFIDVRKKRSLLADLMTIVKQASDRETYVHAEDVLDRLAKIYFGGKQLDSKERRSMETAIGMTVKKKFPDVGHKKRGFGVHRRRVYFGLQFVEKV